MPLTLLDPSSTFTHVKRRSRKPDLVPEAWIYSSITSRSGQGDADDEKRPALSSLWSHDHAVCEIYSIMPTPGSGTTCCSEVDKMIRINIAVAHVPVKHPEHWIRGHPGFGVAVETRHVFLAV